MGLYNSKENERTKEIEPEYEIINSNIKYEYIPYDNEYTINRKRKGKTITELIERHYREHIFMKKRYFGTIYLDKKLELFETEYKNIKTNQVIKFYKIDELYFKSLDIYLKSLRYNINNYKKIMENRHETEEIKDTLKHNEDVYGNIKNKNIYKK